MRAGTVLLGFGLLIVLVLAWYHGDRGAQRVSLSELVLLLAIWIGAGTTAALVAKQEPINPPDAPIATVAERGSIAVLPFVNVSGDLDNEYFSDGITEEILNVLTQLPGLRVAARTSSFAFKGMNVPINSIADSLNVAVVLGGSVRKDGDRVRITAHLVNAQDGYQLWSEQYDRKLEDVFAVQEEIAHVIAERLRLGIDSQSRPRLRGTTINTRAHDAYLIGLAHWNRRATEVNQAIQSFTEATRLDPSYALAFAGLANAYSLQSFYTDESPERALAAAQAAIDRALAIDSLMPQPWATAAHIAFHFELDNAKAHRLMQRAFALGLNDASAHQWFGEILEVDRRYEDAESEHRVALEMDPLSSNAIASYADFLGRHDTERAETQLRRVLQLYPDFRPSRILYGMLLLEQKRWSEATAQLRHAADSTDIEHVVNGLVDPSRRSDALRAVERIRAARALNSLAFSELALSLGDEDRALRILENAAAVRDPLIAFAPVARQFAPLVDHPRFVRIFANRSGGR